MNVLPIDEKKLYYKYPLSPFFEKLIDKKINNIALTIFEWIMDKLSSFFYSNYQKRFNFRLGLHRELTLNLKDEMIHNLRRKAPLYPINDVPLYRCTVGENVDIRHTYYCDLYTKEILKRDPDEIYLNDLRVIFEHPHIKGNFYFGKQYNTREMVILNSKEFKEIVMVFEREIKDNNIAIWCIDKHPVNGALKGKSPNENILIGTKVFPI